MLRVVPGRDRPHPAPNDLYRDERQREAFQAWVLRKIEWAQGEAVPPFPSRPALCPPGVEAVERWLFPLPGGRIKEGGCPVNRASCSQVLKGSP